VGLEYFQEMPSGGCGGSFFESERMHHAESKKMRFHPLLLFSDIRLFSNLVKRIKQ